MKLSRCLVLALALAVPVTVRSQTTGVQPLPTSRETRFPGDERQARLAERYRAMLAANPSEGTALDRLWKLWDEQHATAALVDSFADEARKSDNASGWLIYGHLLKKAGRLDEAAKSYDRAALVDPAGYLPFLARGELALAKQDPVAAAPLLAEAVGKLPSNDPHRADLRMKLGDAWMAAGQADKAAESWDAVVAENPANFPLRRQIAERFEHNRLTDRALLQYEFLAGHDAAPQQAAALREIGRMRENRGEFDPARDAFERALALTARDNWLHGELLMFIIRLYERAGRGTELAERWRRDAAQSPRDLGGLLRLEKLAETLGDAAGQRESLEKIVALAPRDRNSRLKLARLLTNLGERDKAAAAYDALLTDQPKQLDLLIARAELDVQSGNLDAAAKRLEERLAAAPDDETVSTPVLEFFLAHHLDGPAERLLQRSVTRHPVALEPSMALARFYLVHRRTGEARRILDHLADRLPTDAARAECWQRVAALYRETDLPKDALRAWRQVEQALPDKPAPKTAIAELLLADGETEAAAGKFEQAADLSPEGPEREAAEKRLFEVLSTVPDTPASLPKTGVAAIDLRRRAALRLSPDGSVTPAAPPVGKTPLAQYLARLEASATDDPTTTNRLRLARWQTWSHASAEAAQTLEKIVADDPANVPARQQLVNLALEAKQADVAQRHLRDLLRIDPNQRTAYLRQLADIQMEQGNPEAALSAYGELVEAQPGSADALSDLALAQQRADRWLDALTTWQRAYVLPALSPVQRGKILRPLVAAYEHLADFRTAAGTLLAAADAQSDGNGRQELVRDLSDFCRRYGLSEWLEETFERRRAAAPDDYPTLMALAELRTSQGRAFDACEILSRAYYSAPDPAVALKALTEAAESAGENGRAVTAWRRLLSLPGQSTSANLQRLAALEEDDLDEGAATHSWDTLVARFPRDVGALVLASEFFERIGQDKRACRLLGDALTLDPNDLGHLFHLGELERDAGEPANAWNHFENLLARTEAVPPNGALDLPDDLKTAPKTGAVPREPSAAAGHAERGLRLRALRELAHLLPSSGAVPGGAMLGGTNPRQAWTQRWQRVAEQGAREEPLMALYESGESTVVMDLLEQWMSEKPSEERLRSAYLQAGLRLREYRRLAAWTWPEDNVDRQIARGPLLIEAIQQFLARDGEPSESISDELFPDYLRARDLLWRAAECFADRQWLRQAAKLGKRVTRLTGNDSPAYGFETARWLLLLGEADRARALLGEVMAGCDVAYDGSGASPSLEALRVSYTLLPGSERTAYIETRLRACRERGAYVSEILSGVLLHGLHGDWTQAEDALDKMLDQRLLGTETRDSADIRHWLYVLNFGNQLQAWHLEKLALHLWRRALRNETAFDRTNASLQGTLAELRGRLLVLETLSSDNPERTREIATDFLRRPPPVGVVSSTASQLLSLGQFPAARQLYEFLMRSEPNDGDHWRNYLSLCETLGDGDAAERTLQGMLDNPEMLPPAVSRAEIVRLLASWQQKGGDTAGAIRLLERESRESGGASTVLTSLAYAYENAGMYDEARRVWRMGAETDAGNARNYRLALARLEEARGNLPQAIEILQREQAANPSIVSGEGPLRLASLYLKGGRVADARLLAERALGAQDFQSLLNIAKVFVRANQQGQARDLFAIGAKRCREPALQFRFQQEWLQITEREPGESPGDYLRGLRRLRKLALLSPSLRQASLASVYPLARAHHADTWLEDELKREWRDGKGNSETGQWLVKFYQETRQPEALRQFVESVLRLPGVHEEVLTSLAAPLLDGEDAVLALPICEHLARRYPQNEAHTICLAKALGKSGRTDAAIRLLEMLDRTSVVRGEISIQIAEAYQQLNMPERATDLLRRAVASDPTAARFPQAYSRLAQSAAERGDWPEARRLLSTLSRQPAVGKNMQPLVNCLFGSGEIDTRQSAGMPGREFALTFPQRADLLALIYQRLKDTRHLDEAKSMLTAHSDFVPESYSLASAMLADADTGQLSACVASLEQARRQSDLAMPRTTRMLAACYLRLAALETNDDPSGTSRLAHLTRARQLAPQAFEIARRLASLCWEQGKAAEAAEALQPFLKPEAVPNEREQARQLLAQH